MNFWAMLSLILVFFFVLIIHPVPDAYALSIFDYASCKHTLEKLEDIGSYTYTALFGNSENQRFCMSMFEKGITLREIKDHHEIPQLGIQIDLPKNWSGFEVYEENATIAFVTPDKKKSKPIEPLWMMLVTIDKSLVEETKKKIYKLVEESLNDVPHFMNTCKFKESTIVEINDTEFKEEIVKCIDRRLSLFVTISSYSFILDEHEIFLVSATRHLPSLSFDNYIDDYLQTLKIEKSLNNTANIDISVSETKRSDFPSWFNRYVSLWGMEKITDRELISTFNFLLKNKILNESHYSNPGFYNEAKIPDWFRDNAIWFGKGLVTEDEFESSFKYLVENRIIII
jgi:hypothetical protein